MTKQQILPLLKQRSWLILPLLAVLSLSVGLVIAGRPNPSSQPLALPKLRRSLQASPSPNSPAPTKRNSPTPSPAATATPSPQLSSQPTVAPANVDPAELTEQEKAMNQRAIAEFEATSPSVDSMIEMQVSLAEQVPSLILSPAAAAQVLDEQGKPLQQLAAAASYPIRANGNAIQLGSWEFPSSVWINLPLDGLFSLGDRTYRGQLLLVAEAGHLWAVNHVNMRHYLYSVVGSEVPPTWDMEALKAQAVAARSYALVHYFRPASPVFHLGSTQAYQVYSGIEREADTIRQAVDTTAGEFVGQNGGIVESMYAASDEIVASAFEGRGMSQLGALDLAQQGYSYEQILSNYYPGTAITRIELEH